MLLQLFISKIDTELFKTFSKKDLSTECYLGYVLYNYFAYELLKK